MSDFQTYAPTSGTISSSTSVIKITPTGSFPTDIWRKPGPPYINTFNAPLYYKTLSLSKFQSVRVTVSAEWKGLYDQGGLVFIIPNGEQGTGDGEIGADKRKWVKTGIEFFDGRPYVGTVACDRFADWSLSPLGLHPHPNPSSKSVGVTLLISRKEKDDTFWVYIIDEDGTQHPIREITWALSEQDQEVWVGVYAATPTGMDVEKGEERKEKLEVSFEGLEVKER